MLLKKYAMPASKGPSFAFRGPALCFPFFYLRGRKNAPWAVCTSGTLSLSTRPSGAIGRAIYSAITFLLGLCGGGTWRA